MAKYKVPVSWEIYCTGIVEVEAATQEDAEMIVLYNEPDTKAITQEYVMGSFKIVEKSP